MLSNIVRRNGRLLKKCWTWKTIKLPSTNPKFLRLGVIPLRKPLLSTIVFSLFKNEYHEDFANRVTDTIAKGQDSTIDLLVEIKDRLQVVSEEYRKCLDKQIQVTLAAREVTAKWDELPELRVTAEELDIELKTCINIFRTIGQMAKTGTLHVLADDADNIFFNIESEKLIAKYNELEHILLMEIELNKQKELEYLNVKKDSILI